MDVCTCGLVKQSKAGTEVRDGIEYCKSCGRPAEVSLRQPPGQPPLPRSAAPQRSMKVNTAQEVRSSAQYARDAAQTLKGIALVLLVLALVGMGTLILAGIASLDDGGWFLISYAVGWGLLWMLLFAVCQAISARLVLAADVAEHDLAS